MHLAVVINNEKVEDQTLFAFRGGELHERIVAAPEDLKADAFCIADGNAVKGKCPSGKDIGAVLDVAGPGSACERWRQTPEHKEWQKKVEATQIGM